MNQNERLDCLTQLLIDYDRAENALSRLDAVEFANALGLIRIDATWLGETALADAAESLAAKTRAGIDHKTASRELAALDVLVRGITIPTFVNTEQK